MQFKQTHRPIVHATQTTSTPGPTADLNAVPYTSRCNNGCHTHRTSGSPADADATQTASASESRRRESPRLRRHTDAMSPPWTPCGTPDTVPSARATVGWPTNHDTLTQCTQVRLSQYKAQAQTQSAIHSEEVLYDETSVFICVNNRYTVVYVVIIVVKYT